MIAYVQITEPLVQSAGQLTQEHGLCGYLAVHLAAALVVEDPNLIFVSGDRDLADAASRVGLAVANLRTYTAYDPTNRVQSLAVATVCP